MADRKDPKKTKAKDGESAEPRDDQAPEAEGSEAENAEAADTEAMGAQGRPEEADGAETASAADMDADSNPGANPGANPDGEEAIQDAEIVEDTGHEPETASAAPSHDAAEPAAAYMLTSAAPAEPPRRGGFLPLLLGGVLAAGLGAGALWYADSRGWVSLGGGQAAAQLDAQARQIADLKAALEKAQADLAARIDAVQAGQPDIAPLQEALEQLKSTDAEVARTLQEMTAALADLRERVGKVEVQEIPQAQLPKEVTEAYERQLADILATIETRFEGMQKAQKETITRLEAELRAQLAKIESTEEQARKAADAAAARAAAVRITVALDTGAPFAEELGIIADKAGIEAPDALAAVAETGAMTLNALREQFPELARRAIADTAREAAAEGKLSPLQALLVTQLGARSVEPREGDTPDAILSRAEAALKAGDLDTALAEIETLPEKGKAHFTDWLKDARALRDAKAAAAELAAQLENM